MTDSEGASTDSNPETPSVLTVDDPTQWSGDLSGNGNEDKEITGTLSAIDEDNIIEIPVKTINQELKCPVCLQLIQKKRTVMDCLHRFCAECIGKSLRIG